MVAAGVSDEILVQLAYAIGIAEPVSVYVNTYGRAHVNLTDGEIAGRIKRMFDFALSNRTNVKVASANVSRNSSLWTHGT